VRILADGDPEPIAAAVRGILDDLPVSA
jgi:hypothetical protein